MTNSHVIPTSRTDTSTEIVVNYAYEVGQNKTMDGLAYIASLYCQHDRGWRMVELEDHGGSHAGSITTVTDFLSTETRFPVHQ